MRSYSGQYALHFSSLLRQSSKHGEKAKGRVVCIGAILSIPQKLFDFLRFFCKLKNFMMMDDFFELPQVWEENTIYIYAYSEKNAAVVVSNEGCCISLMPELGSQLYRDCQHWKHHLGIHCCLPGETTVEEAKRLCAAMWCERQLCMRYRPASFPT